MKNNKILITGGAGFIGSHLCEKLVEKGYEVTVLDKLTPQIHGDNVLKSYLVNKIKDKVNFIFGDVCDLDLMREVLPKQNYIIHLAAETGTGQSMYKINKYTKANVLGSSNIVEVLTNEKHNIKKVIYASTRAIYGEGKYKCNKHGFVYPLSRKDSALKKGDFECKCPICNRTLEQTLTDEASMPNSVSLYGITKYSGEQILYNQCKSLGIDFVAFRMQNVYGEGQSLTNPYTGILSIFSSRLLKNQSINIFEDGQESRDFIHINDITNAYVLSIENKNIRQEIINLGSGKNYSVMEITQMLAKNYKSTSKIIISGDYRIGDIRHNAADITKAKKLLNWSPKIEIEEGIQLFANWVKHQDINNTNQKYENSLKELEDKGLFIRNKNTEF